VHQVGFITCTYRDAWSTNIKLNFIVTEFLVFIDSVIFWGEKQKYRSSSLFSWEQKQVQFPESVLLKRVKKCGNRKYNTYSVSESLALIKLQLKSTCYKYLLETLAVQHGLKQEALSLLILKFCYSTTVWRSKKIITEWNTSWTQKQTTDMRWNTVTCLYGVTSRSSLNT
jgi:hypothetical protein